jgi:hypothetical protein
MEPENTQLRYWQPAAAAWLTFILSFKWLGWRGLTLAIVSFFVGAFGTIYNGLHSGVINGSDAHPS